MVALLQNKKFSFEEKLVVAASGAGDVNIITMCIIYLLAGVFSAVVTAAGGVTSTVNFALSIIPVDFAVTGLFLMGCFISLAMDVPSKGSSSISNPSGASPNSSGLLEVSIAPNILRKSLALVESLIKSVNSLGKLS